ncbi:MAG TPA: hypothetical protein VK184_26530 [Nostocaceae cyanobacterium]|nr:hypothetical protein [Nostocaceae cyanobacterium]
MIFLASAAKPIDESLKNIVNEIEAQSLSLSVLVARQFCYSLYQSPIEVTIRETRPFNVLEEFIIRAGIEFEPPPTPEELASVLGLDPVFIQSTIANLQTLQTLVLTPQIKITAEGREFYQRGSVPKLPYSLDVYVIYDPLLDDFTCKQDALDDVQKKYFDLADFIKVEQGFTDISILTSEERLQLIQSPNLGLHLPEVGKIVTSCKLIAPTQKIWQNISVFVIFDVLEDKLSVQIRKGRKIVESASQKLDTLHNTGKISLNLLCELSDEIIASEREISLKYKNLEIENKINKLQKMALENITKNSGNEKHNLTGKVIQLRNEKIAQVFWDVLKSAQRQILIYSPWVSDAVVDEKFLKLLEELVNRGVWVLIGYGIARRKEDEDRPISPEVETKLRKIKTPDGLPGVQISWLGNSHVKEVIVDQKVHLCGSHNWLSYRGDYLPRGESVYQVTIPEQVTEAYDFLASRFENYAQILWKNFLQNHDLNLAEEVLCIWGALGMEEMAIQEIERNNCLELMPIWLNVVLHGFKSQSISCKSPGLKVAFSLLNRLSGKEVFMDLFKQKVCQIYDVIINFDRDTATSLFTREVKQELLRLKIEIGKKTQHRKI